MTGNLSFGIAFFAGIASFLSPCVFALVPAYVGYLSGRSVSSGADEKTSSMTTFSHGLAFVLGFSLVFILLGAVAGALGSLLYQITDLIVKIGGVVVVIFGLHMTKIIQIPFLNYDLRAEAKTGAKHGYWSSILMGVFFSAGWAPCVGPVLGAILTLSFREGAASQGALLLTAYSLGLAIPFLIAATQISWVTTILRRYGKVMRIAEIVMGIVLIILGVMLFIGRFETLASLGSFFEFYDEVLLGRLLMLGVTSSLVLALVPGLVARSKGKNFIDTYFLAFGLVFVLLIVLYLAGALNFVLPWIA